VNLGIGGWLILVMTALAAWNVGVIWLMQLLIYPQFAEVPSDRFRAYHLSHWRKSRYVVLVPAAVILGGSVAMLRFPPPRAPLWIPWSGVALQAAIWLGTWRWWARLQIRLNREGNHPTLVRLLVRTHWLRTGMITAYAVLVLAMLSMGLARP
jgi:hypothetical protein